MGFTDYLKDPTLGGVYRKIRKHFGIRESAYDVTSACQLRCDGCYYFQGDKYQVRDNRNAEDWHELMKQERERGINFVNLAGAEPALVPRILEACYQEIPSGCIFTNGLKPIAPNIKYRIHISVWGDETGDSIYRKLANGKKGPYCLPNQLKNYENDDRVVFVYTFNRENVTQVDNVVSAIHEHGHKVTFNVYSSPEKHGSLLSLGESIQESETDSLERIREKMFKMIVDYPDSVLYSYYNAFVHTHPLSLRKQFGCPYPRADGGPGIGTTFRSYRANLTHVADHNCCVPDTDCSQCRHYAAGSAIVSSKLSMHAKSERLFRAWLDYVDTYLSIWVMGYQRETNFLCSREDVEAFAELPCNGNQETHVGWEHAKP